MGNMKTLTIALATAIIAVTLQWTIGWVVYDQLNLWQTIPNTAYQNILIGVAVSTIVGASIIGLLAKPKETEPKNSLSKKDEVLNENLKFLMKYGTEDEKRAIAAKHPELVGLTQMETAEQNNFSLGVSPQAIASPPTNADLVYEKIREMQGKTSPSGLPYPPSLPQTKTAKTHNNGNTTETYEDILDRETKRALNEIAQQNITFTAELKDGKMVIKKLKVTGTTQPKTKNKPETPPQKNPMEFPDITPTREENNLEHT